MSGFRLHTVLLPDGTEPVELFVDAGGRIADGRISDAETLPGAFVLPGLVDAHAHVTVDFTGSGVVGAELVRVNLERHLAAGELVVRDAGAMPGVPLNHVAGLPRVIGSGMILAPEGPYASFMRVAVREDELVAAALRQVQSGAAWVKIFADVPEGGKNYLRPQRTYSRRALLEVAHAVHTAGARICAHASGDVVPDLVDAGFDSIEHGPAIDSATIQRMVEKGTAWTTTLTTVAGALEWIAANVPPAASAAQSWLEQLRQNVVLATQAGVTLLTGTDEKGAGTVAAEAKRLVEFGATPHTAIAAASTTARAFMGMPALVPGAPADLVTFDHDPRDDVTALANPTIVLIGGTVTRRARAPG